MTDPSAWIQQFDEQEPDTDDRARARAALRRIKARASNRETEQHTYTGVRTGNGPAGCGIPAAHGPGVVCTVTGHIVDFGHGPDCHQTDRNGPGLVVTTRCAHRQETR